MSALEISANLYDKQDDLTSPSSTPYIYVLFVFGVFRPTREFFNSLGDVTIAGEGLQISTDARHLWPLSSEGSLVCYTYCYTGHPFLMVISDDPWHSNLMPSVWQWCYHYLFLRLMADAAGI